MGPPNGNAKVAAVVAETERLRREDHLRVKHDKLFSDWKILVGPADWKDHAASEEGSQRYRIHNLPAAYFGPGVYELGLTTQNTPHSSAQDSKHRTKLRRHAVVVVYLGQADNVRHRLQRYGQTGSHLEGTRSSPVSAVEENVESHSVDILQPDLRGSQGGLRLFTEVFSRGFSIAFRWARTESKLGAERVESELLRVFDYPWNTSLNGARRPRDILTKLEMLQYHLERSFCLGKALGIEWRKWEYLGTKVGIPVEVRKPTKEGSDYNPARPKSSTGFCAVLLEDGSTCSNPPVQGRRRCSMHKGRQAKLSTRRTQALTSVVAQNGDVNLSKLSTQQQIRPRTSVLAQDGGNIKTSVVTVRANATGKRVQITDISSNGSVVCGAIVDGKSPCLNLPMQGRKRCSNHKGMRIRKSKSAQKIHSGE